MHQIPDAATLRAEDAQMMMNLERARQSNTEVMNVRTSPVESDSLVLYTRLSVTDDFILIIVQCTYAGMLKTKLCFAEKPQPCQESDEQKG